MFDYFYGQSGEMFSYFRVSKILFRDIKFKDLSTDAKTLYGILLDRMGLSFCRPAFPESRKERFRCRGFSAAGNGKITRK